MSHRTWLLETGQLAGQEHPLLTLFSPQFLSQGPQTYAQLRQLGYTELVVYMAQQIQQFRLMGAAFAMQHLGSETEMQQALRDLMASFPPEERLAGLDLDDFVASLPVEKRLAGLPPEQRLAGLSPQERVAGLSPEEQLASLSPEAKELFRRQLQSDKPSDPAK